MSGLADLPDVERRRLCDAFAAARKLWGTRASLARQLVVDTTTLQALEGKRGVQVSDDMINRITVFIGWPPGSWREVASGAAVPPLARPAEPATDQPRALSEVSISDLLAEIARRTDEAH